MITIKTKPSHDFKELKKNNGLESLYAFRAIKKQIEDKYNFKFTNQDPKEILKEFYYKFVNEV
jgi:hypothetical protein